MSQKSKPGGITARITYSNCFQWKNKLASYLALKLLHPYSTYVVSSNAAPLVSVFIFFILKEVCVFIFTKVWKLTHGSNL